MFIAVQRAHVQGSTTASTAVQDFGRYGIYGLVAIGKNYSYEHPRFDNRTVSSWGCTDTQLEDKAAGWVSKFLAIGARDDDGGVWCSLPRSRPRSPRTQGLEGSSHPLLPSSGVQGRNASLPMPGLYS